MATYKVINQDGNRFALNQIEVNTWEDRNTYLHGYPHVLIQDSGQFMPHNVHFEIEVGKFKVIWILDNWLGYVSNGYGKINEGFSVYVSHKWDNTSSSYILVKEYSNISTIEGYFEILDYYQNFRDNEYLNLMLYLANSLAELRDKTGVNSYVNSRYGKSIPGAVPVQSPVKIEPINELVLSKISID